MLKEDPENPVHWGNYVEAFSSLCSAKGVIKAALTGDALAFMSKVNRGYDGGGKGGGVGLTAPSCSNALCVPRTCR